MSGRYRLTMRRQAGSCPWRARTRRLRDVLSMVGPGARRKPAARAWGGAHPADPPDLLWHPSSDLSTTSDATRSPARDKDFGSRGGRAPGRLRAGRRFFRRVCKVWVRRALLLSKVKPDTTGRAGP